MSLHMLFFFIFSTNIHGPPSYSKTSLLNTCLHRDKEILHGHVAFLSIFVLDIHCLADIFPPHSLATPDCCFEKGRKEWRLLHLLAYFLITVHFNFFACSKNWNMNLPYWVYQKPKNISPGQILDFNQKRLQLYRKEEGINYEEVLSYRYYLVSHSWLEEGLAEEKQKQDEFY